MILLRILKDNRLAGTMAVVLLLIAIYVPSFIETIRMNGEELLPFTCMPFYKLIFGAIHKVPVVNHLVAMLITMLIGYILIRIGVRDQLLQHRSVMPGIFLILFTSALPEARQVSPALISSLFYILCFVILFEAHDKKTDTLSIFSASLILALGSMFCLKLIWFVPLIWVSLWTMRSVTFRELLYPLIAFVLLGLFLFTWFWGIKSNAAGFMDLIKENLALTGSFAPYHQSVYIIYAYILVWVGIASIHMIDGFQSRKTVVQNIYQVLFYMFLAGILSFVFIFRFEPTSLVFIAVPVSFILSNYFHRKRSPWIHELAIWILLGLVVYVQLVV